MFLKWKTFNRNNKNVFKIVMVLEKCLTNGFKSVDIEVHDKSVSTGK